MAKDDVTGIDDLLPVLQNPLWQGEDSEFTDYVRETFGVPESFQHITISQKGSAGRSAVAMGDDTEGAIIFALTADDATHTVHVRPLMLGPVTENTDVVERFKRAKRKDHTRAVRELMTRHLPIDMIRELLPTYVH